jgi:hypothetical protein
VSKKINFKDKKVTVVDNGYYVHVAIALAQHFGKVDYVTNWQCAFPSIEPLLVGDGFPGVRRTKDFWKESSDAHLFVFCDIYESGLQLELVRQGKRVWGPRNGDELEIKRWRTTKLLPKIGLSEPPGRVIVGMPNLRSYLKDHDDLHIKVAGLRGMMETKKHTNYDLSEYWLDIVEKQVSGVKNTIRFLVYDDIPDAVEVGYDGWTVDGQWPEVASYGVEAKDIGIISCIRPYADFPAVIRDVMEAFSPMLKEYKYRGFVCAEIRRTKTQSFMIDWAARCGSPSSEALFSVFGNLPEVFWFGAEGKLIKPEKLANFSVEIVVKSPDADQEEWKILQIDDEVRPWVKLHLHARVGGRDMICPQEYPSKELGAIVGIGDTLEEAIAHARKNCDGVKSDSVEFKTDTIEECLNEIADGKEFGITWPGTIPVDNGAAKE